ncbi:MAG: hypothetical protein NTW87_12340 [Planctomycetota bacterium]|nr:hypothetical protein [Planctomycetota bacterium]
MRFLVRAAVFALVLGGVAEVWLRTVMPACERPFAYQQQPSTIQRFDPTGRSSGLWTVGRLCLRGGAWRVNNAGWNSSIDYASAAERRRPLIALLGDSFIEGFLTDTDRHIDAYLPKMLPGTDSYAFGLSGWYLEQYVAVSRYAQERYQPDVIVVFIDSADVSDSLRENGVVSPFWWQIGAEGQSFEELPPTAVSVGRTRKAVLARKSALVRYLLYNAKLTLPGIHAAGIPQPATGAGTLDEGRAAGAVARASDAWRDLLPAAEFMVGRLCAQNPRTPIVFVAHSDRYLPMEDIARTPLFPDGRAVEAACEGRAQCSFIDLRYVFSGDWAAHHVHFESADGNHWNAHANRLIARTLADFITRKGLLYGPK